MSDSELPVPNPSPPPPPPELAARPAEPVRTTMWQRYVAGVRLRGRILFSILDLFVPPLLFILQPVGIFWLALNASVPFLVCAPPLIYLMWKKRDKLGELVGKHRLWNLIRWEFFVFMIIAWPFSCAQLVIPADATIRHQAASGHRKAAGDMDGARGACKVEVEDRLSPKDADFPWTENPIAIDDSNGAWVVTGRVDTQNNFGAPVRAMYVCKVEYINGRYERKSVDIMQM